MPNYAPLIVYNKLPMFSATPTYNYSNLLLSEYLINYNYLICDFNAISVTALLE